MRPRRGKRGEQDGLVFDSAPELSRYIELKMLQRVGEISKLQCHPTFRLIVNEQEICKYTPDFQYIDRANACVVEDVKAWRRSPKTGKLLPLVNREFGIKVKLMKACFGIEVRCV